MADRHGRGHNQREIESIMRISDQENNELNELEEQLQGVYKQIDEIQNRIDEIFIGGNNTSDETTDTDMLIEQYNEITYSQ
jgi:peptidoglycan hydrolase CwlO-like protein